MKVARAHQALAPEAVGPLQPVEELSRYRIKSLANLYIEREGKPNVHAFGPKEVKKLLIRAGADGGDLEAGHEQRLRAEIESRDVAGAHQIGIEHLISRSGDREDALTFEADPSIVMANHFGCVDVHRCRGRPGDGPNLIRRDDGVHLTLRVTVTDDAAAAALLIHDGRRVALRTQVPDLRLRPLGARLSRLMTVRGTLQRCVQNGRDGVGNRPDTI